MIFSKKNFKKIFFYFFAFFIFLILFSNLTIYFWTKDYVYSDIEKIPVKKVGLLLGTAKYVEKNKPNAFYSLRIKTAVELLKKNKINKIVLSGMKDGGYNEPENMKKDIMKFDISQNRLILDFDSYRTLDSILRVKEKFGYNDVIIISQNFHIQRAVFLAQMYNIKAIGIATKNPKWYLGWKVYAREFLSRIKLLNDIIYIKLIN